MKILKWIGLVVLIIITILIGYQLDTKYVEMVNPQGQRVAIAGVMHTGTQYYFSELQNKLDSFHGVVLYEAVRDEDGLEPVMRSYRLMSKLLNMKFQGEAIRYREHWVKSDITISEVERFYSLRDLAAQDEMIEGMISDVENSPISELSRWWYRNLIEVVSLSVLLNPSDPIITERNIKPLVDAEKFLAQGKDVLIFYGDAHRPGMIAALKSDGFRVVEEKTFIPFWDGSTEINVFLIILIIVILSGVMWVVIDRLTEKQILLFLMKVGEWRKRHEK